jgi:hypothetical protein
MIRAMESPATTPPPAGFTPPPAAAAAPRFDPANILWYFGAIVATIAANIVVGDTGDAHRGVWILLVALGFLVGAAALSAIALWLRFWVPGGVLAAAAVALVPAVTVGFEHLIGVWPKYATSLDPFTGFEGVPFSIVAATIAVGLVAFWVVRFGFVLLPVAFSTVLAIQLFLPVPVNHPSADDHEVTLLATGAAFLVLGMLLDARRHRNAAFWWHVLGLFAIAEGLVYYSARDEVIVVSLLPNGTPHRTSWAWIVMLVVGAMLVVAAFAVRRATWAVFGIAGLYAPSLHYIDAWSSSWRLPLLMVFVGVGLVVAGAVLELYGAVWPQRLARPVARRS